MTRRIPVVSTIVVLLAALLMARLGFWQLHRLHEKEALLARYAANQGKPPVPLAALYPIGDDLLYRRTSAICPTALGWTATAGRDRRGDVGYRHIAACAGGFSVDVGVSQSPDTPRWHGGAVTGRVTWLPTSAPLIARLFVTPPPLVPMIVSDVAAPRLAPSARPDPATIPNNHLSYAAQWFIFAALAVGIYGILLWRRRNLP